LSRLSEAGSPAGDFSDLMQTPFKIQKFPVLSSTNQFVHENLDQLAHFTVIVAETQTAGKGRWGRKWLSSSEGNLYFTVVLKENLKSSLLGNLPQIAALAVVHTLSDYQLAAQIKWPNDVLIEGRKICGILSESILRGEALIGLGLGIGLNVNMSQDYLRQIGQPATSILVESGKQANPEKILDHFLQHFYQIYLRVENVDFTAIFEEWKKNLSDPRGKKVQFQGKKVGFVRDVLPSGALLVRFDEGEKIVYSGDIILD